MTMIDRIKQEKEELSKDEISMPYYREPYLSIYEKHLKTANKSEVIEFIQNFGSVFSVSGRRRSNTETIIKHKAIIDFEGPNQFCGDKEVVHAALTTRHFKSQGLQQVSLAYASKEIQELFRNKTFSEGTEALQISINMEKMQEQLKPKPPSPKRGLKI